MRGAGASALDPPRLGNAGVDSWIEIRAEPGPGVFFLAPDRIGRPPRRLAAGALVGLCAPGSACPAPDGDAPPSRLAGLGRRPGDWPRGLLLDRRVVGAFCRNALAGGLRGSRALRPLDGDPLRALGPRLAPRALAGMGLLRVAGGALRRVAIRLAQSIPLHAADRLRRASGAHATRRTWRGTPARGRGGGVGRGRRPGSDPGERAGGAARPARGLSDPPP